MLTEQDKLAIQEILCVMHCDIKYFNLEYIYSKVEEILSSPEAQVYINYLSYEDDEYTLSFDYEDQNNNNFEYELSSILSGNIFIEKDISDQMGELLGKMKKWLYTHKN